MTDKQDESRGDFLAAGPDDQVISDRVQELSWALLDEQMNDDEFMLLENLLLADEKARETYVGCTRLHADLMAHFAVPTGVTGSKPANDSPVLGFLSGDSSLGLQSPSSEEAMQ
jgi:predicted Zn-dependent protease